MVDRPGLAVGAIAVEPLADGEPRLPLGPFAHRLTIPLANEPDRFPIRRTFLAKMLALARGRWAGFSTGGWIDSAGPEYVWAGPAVVPAGSSGRRSRGRSQGLANARGTARIPAGTGLIGHDVAFS